MAVVNTGTLRSPHSTFNSQRGTVQAPNDVKRTKNWFVYFNNNFAYHFYTEYGSVFFLFLLLFRLVSRFHSFEAALLGRWKKSPASSATHTFGRCMRSRERKCWACIPFSIIAFERTPTKKHTYFCIQDTLAPGLLFTVHSSLRRRRILSFYPYDACCTGCGCSKSSKFIFLPFTFSTTKVAFDGAVFRCNFYAPLSMFSVYVHWQPQMCERCSQWKHCTQFSVFVCVCVVYYIVRCSHPEPNALLFLIKQLWNEQHFP